MRSLMWCGNGRRKANTPRHKATCRKNTRVCGASVLLSHAMYCHAFPNQWTWVTSHVKVIDTCDLSHGKTCFETWTWVTWLQFSSLVIGYVHRTGIFSGTLIGIFFKLYMPYAFYSCIIILSGEQIMFKKSIFFFAQMMFIFYSV